VNASASAQERERAGQYVTMVSGIIETLTENEGAVGESGAPKTIPVAGAVVAAWGTPFSAVTDAGGRFILQDVPEGPHRLVVTLPGHDSWSTPQVTLLAGRPFELGVVVSKAPLFRSPPTLTCTADRSLCVNHPRPLLTHAMLIVDGVIQLDEAPVNIASLDIQRMQLMTGAAAAPLYGQRAAIGAVVIGTRRLRF
jgi:hypothetical protein